jgi:alpha-1,3-rhamnosyl/mannosyltransferase
VIATEIEACPNIAIEAMAAGCVIVSGDRPPLPEMFQGCSLEYGARDIDLLAQKIRQAVTNDLWRVEMKAKALKRAENFSWDKCAMDTYAALTQWP